MRLTFPVVTIALAGCAAGYDRAAPIEPIPEPVERPAEFTCDANPVQRHVGEVASQATGSAILDHSGARTLRWGPPDSAWTMDYRTDRVNVRYDRAMKITAITCG